MSQKIKMYGLAAVLVILVCVVYLEFFSHAAVQGLPGVAPSDSTFVALDVQEPHLRLDQLARLQKSEYSGTHRNVFVAEQPPPPKSAAQQNAPPPFVGPRLPPPPPPLQVPGEFYGYASTHGAPKRVALFKNGTDVQLLAEGDTFLGNLRMTHVGDNSVDVQEISSGRRTTVQMVQPGTAQER